MSLNPDQDQSVDELMAVVYPTADLEERGRRIQTEAYRAKRDIVNNYQVQMERFNSLLNDLRIEEDSNLSRLLISLANTNPETLVQLLVGISDAKKEIDNQLKEIRAHIEQVISIVSIISDNGVNDHQYNSGLYVEPLADNLTLTNGELRDILVRIFEAKGMATEATNSLNSSVDVNPEEFRNIQEAIARYRNSIVNIVLTDRNVRLNDQGAQMLVLRSVVDGGKLDYRGDEELRAIWDRMVVAAPKDSYFEDQNDNEHGQDD